MNEIHLSHFINHVACLNDPSIIKRKCELLKLSNISVQSCFAGMWYNCSFATHLCWYKCGCMALKVHILYFSEPAIQCVGFDITHYNYVKVCTMNHKAIFRIPSKLNEIALITNFVYIVLYCALDSLWSATQSWSCCSTIWNSFF